GLEDSPTSLLFSPARGHADFVDTRYCFRCFPMSQIPPYPVDFPSVIGVSRDVPGVLLQFTLFLWRRRRLAPQLGD
ncbi:MAG TPA: hypothetical protein VGF39_01300, partial [Stellaceae bacterium]